jgi:hypothetical protein
LSVDIGVCPKRTIRKKKILCQRPPKNSLNPHVETLKCVHFYLHLVTLVATFCSSVVISSLVSISCYAISFGRKQSTVPLDVCTLSLHQPLGHSVHVSKYTNLQVPDVCSEIHTKHINTLCGQNVEFVNVKYGIK